MDYKRLFAGKRPAGSNVMDVYNTSSVPIGSKMKSSMNLSAHRQCQAQHIIHATLFFIQNAPLHGNEST
jgi:hypothetical protein